MRSADCRLQPYSELVILEAAEMARLPRAERFLKRMGLIAGSAEKPTIIFERSFSGDTCTESFRVKSGSFVLEASQTSAPLVSNFSTYQVGLRRRDNTEFVGKVGGILGDPDEWPMHAEFAKEVFDNLARRRNRRLSPGGQNIADKNCYAGLASSLVDRQKGLLSPAQERRSSVDFNFELLRGM